MVSISQMGRQGSNTAMAQVEVQMEAATRRTNLTPIFFKNKNKNMFKATSGPNLTRICFKDEQKTFSGQGYYYFRATVTFKLRSQ